MTHFNPFNGHRNKNRAPIEGPDWNDEHVRSAVLQLLKEVNQSTLARLSPLSQPMISNILNSKHTGKIGSDKCREFGAWYLKYRQENPAEVFESCPKDARLTFHPLHEIPKLRHWYQTWKNPSDAILKQLVDEINSGPVRKERAPVSLSKLKMWWKNEKQRLKRIQVQGGTPPRTRVKPSRDRNLELMDHDDGEESEGLLDISSNNIPNIVESQADPMFSSTLNSSSPDKLNITQQQQHHHHHHQSPSSINAKTSSLCVISPVVKTDPTSNQRHNVRPHAATHTTTSLNNSQTDSSPEQYMQHRMMHPPKGGIHRSPPLFSIPTCQHINIASRAAGLYTLPPGAHGGIYNPYLPQQTPIGLPVFPGPEMRLRSPPGTPSPRAERL